MPFQSTVYLQQGFGVVGELAFGSPHRCIPGILDSDDATNNVVGRAFTIKDGATATFDSSADPHAVTVQAGGPGVFAGIMVRLKEYASYGGATGPLSPTTQLDNAREATFCLMGEIIVAATEGTAVGNLVYYDNKTGELAFAAPNAPAPSGKTLIPTAIVHMYTSTGPSLAVIRMTEPGLVFPGGGGGGGQTVVAAGNGIDVKTEGDTATVSLNAASVASLAKADKSLQDASQFATKEQGAKADTAVQPAVLGDYAKSADLGALAKKDKVTVPGDFTATGTPSADTDLAGDNSWKTRTAAQSAARK